MSRRSGVYLLYEYNNIAYKAVALEQANYNVNALLLAAIKTHKLENLKFLLRCDIDLLSKNTLPKLPIQIAFEHSYWDYILLLLKHGSSFPKGLNIDLIPRQEHELLKFISICQRYTELIKNNSLDEIREAIDTQKITKIFRSIDNQSAVSLAFRAQSYESYVFLKFKGFSQFVDEEPLEINKLSIDAQLRIKRAMMSLAKDRK